MAGQTQFVTATQGMAVDRGDKRLAGLFHAPEHPMHHIHEVFKHGLVAIAHGGEIGANHEFLVGRGDNDAFDVFISDSLVQTGGIGRHGLLIEDIHGAVEDIPGNGGNAVAIHLVIHHGACP